MCGIHSYLKIHIQTIFLYKAKLKNKGVLVFYELLTKICAFRDNLNDDRI